MRRFLVLVSAILAGCSEPADQSANHAAETNETEAQASGDPTPSARSDERESVFTSLDQKDCKTIDANEEGGGDWAGECPGNAGYRVQIFSGDLRDDLVLIRDGKETALSIPMIVSKGAFDALGMKAEWRGPVGKAPDVLLARVHVTNSKGKSDSGSLVVARLDPTPCIVAIVPPGRGQSDDARKVADNPLPSCLKN